MKSDFEKNFKDLKIELLAPAGDISSFERAIACGADAVYLGLSDFNARLKADNFTAENLREHIKRAHFYGVRVYVTVALYKLSIFVFKAKQI